MNILPQPKHLIDQFSNQEVSTISRTIALPLNIFDQVIISVPSIDFLYPHQLTETKVNSILMSCDYFKRVRFLSNIIKINISLIY